MDNTTLAAKIRELKELQIMADELTGIMEGIKEEIKQHMTATGAGELTVDIHRIKWQTIISNRLDAKKLQADHADLYRQYCTPSVSKRFTIA